MVKPVAIYADHGTSLVGIYSLEKACKQILQRTCKRVFSEDILHSDLSQYALLIMPGGADLPYCERLNGMGNYQIQKFVANGGRYLGICAGAYYGCASLDFTGLHYKVSGKRELSFFDGIAVGSLPELTNGHYFDDSSQSKAVVTIQFTDIKQNHTACYYHGGCTFIENPQSQRKSQVLAHYANGKSAIVAGTFGQGYFALSGVHFEVDADCYAREIIAKAPHCEREQEMHIYQQIKLQNSHMVWQKVMQALSF